MDEDQLICFTISIKV